MLLEARLGTVIRKVSQQEVRDLVTVHAPLSVEADTSCAANPWRMAAQAGSWGRLLLSPLRDEQLGPPWDLSFANLEWVAS